MVWPRRRRTRAVIAAGVVAALSLSLALRLWVWPDLDEPGTADAVFVLGGGGPREAYGLDLIVDGVADTLVFFTPFVEELDVYAVRSCNTRPDVLAAHVELVCLEPEPQTTRGEVRAIRHEAEARGWDEVVVVASTDQITRARMLLARCWDGEARFTGPDHSDPWLVRVLYEAGALAKALVVRGC